MRCQCCGIGRNLAHLRQRNANSNRERCLTCEGWQVQGSADGVTQPCGHALQLRPPPPRLPQRRGQGASPMNARRGREVDARRQVEECGGGGRGSSRGERAWIEGKREGQDLDQIRWRSGGVMRGVGCGQARELIHRAQQLAPDDEWLQLYSRNF